MFEPKYTITPTLLANIKRIAEFERYYNGNVTKYFATVGERGSYYDLNVDFTPWLEYFTDGVLDEILRVKELLEKTVESPTSGLKDHHRTMLEYLREHPSINDTIYATLVDRATYYTAKS